MSPRVSNASASTWRKGLGLAHVGQFCSRNWRVIDAIRGKSAALDDLKAAFPPISLEK
jgi:hypothetical protein